MGWKLIHIRMATREHFFYRDPKLETREKGCYCCLWVKTSRHTQFHIGNITSTLVTRWYLEEVMLSRQLKRSVQRWGCKYSCLLFGIEPINVFRGCVLPWALNNVPLSEYHKQQLVLVVLTDFNCLKCQRFREKTDVFIHFSPSAWVSTTSPSVDLTLYPLKRDGLGVGGGCHMAVRTKHVISINRDGPWGCLLLCSDLLVSVQLWMALCASTGPGGEGLKRTTKRRLL